MHTFHKEGSKFVVTFEMAVGGRQFVRDCDTDIHAIQLVNILNGGSYTLDTLKGILDE